MVVWYNRTSKINTDFYVCRLATLGKYSIILALETVNKTILSSSSSSSSPSCGVFILVLLRQIMSLRNTVLQLFCCYYSCCFSLVSVLNLLYFYISTFRSMCTVPNMAIFSSSLTSWFPGMLLTYFLNDFEILLLLIILIVWSPLF